MESKDNQLSEPLVSKHMPEEANELKGLIALTIATVLGVLVLSTQSYLFSSNPTLTTW